jgi:hypothetical protein
MNQLIVMYYIRECLDCHEIFTEKNYFSLDQQVVIDTHHIDMSKILHDHQYKLTDKYHRIVETKFEQSEANLERSEAKLKRSEIGDSPKIMEIRKYECMECNSSYEEKEIITNSPLWSEYLYDKLYWEHYSTCDICGKTGAKKYEGYSSYEYPNKKTKYICDDCY